MTARIANRMWVLSCRPATESFETATRSVKRVQEAALRRILLAAGDTVFGREHMFARSRSISDFRTSVRLRDYDEFLPYIERTAAGERGVLVPGLPVHFEPTSGSVAATKLVPQTPALRREYAAGIAPWVFDTYRRRTAAFRGPAYWALSPAVSAETTTPGGLRVGFGDDADYLGPVARRLAARIVAVPSRVRQIADTRAWRYVTLAFLLARHDLTLISVWSPTFLELLADGLDEDGERLVKDLATGSLSGVSDLAPAERRAIEQELPPLRRHAAELRAALSRPSRAERHAILWPRLDVISCWCDAAAAGPARQLAADFPQARLEPKGLLATEGIVTFPWHGMNSVLAIRSHFYEFTSTDSAADVRCAWELEEGRTYSVVLTTGGGLYRYRLGDRVEVTGFYNECPVLRFLGRDDLVSDLRGEKLSEGFVSQSLDAVWRQLGLAPAFAVVVPADTGYILLADSTVPVPQLRQAAALLDKSLCTGFHYAYCRRLRQLSAVRPASLRVTAVEAARRLLEDACSTGRRAATVKPRTLLQRCPVPWRLV